MFGRFPVRVDKLICRLRSISVKRLTVFCKTPSFPSCSVNNTLPAIVCGELCAFYSIRLICRKFYTESVRLVCMGFLTFLGSCRPNSPLFR